VFDLQQKPIVGYQTDKRISWWDVAMMRSNRERHEDFDNDLELAMEMGVEYLVTGKIRINTSLIREKCVHLGLDYNSIIHAIEKGISNFKRTIHKQLVAMEGTTRYI
jgi:hypothetical protein